MNVASSIFVGRGYLLTALAVAVLVAGFPGTAQAQPSSISVNISMQLSSSVEEGASRDASTPGRVPLTIGWSAAKYDPNLNNTDTTERDSVFTTGDTSGHLTLTATCNGETFADAPDAATNPCGFSIETKDGTDLTGLATLGGTGTPITFAGSGEGTDVENTIELFISDSADDNDWNEETVVLTLELAKTSVSITNSGGTAVDVPLRATARKSTLTILEDDPMPKLTFTPPSIQLARGNMLAMEAGVDISGTSGAKAGIRGTLSALATSGEDDILLSVSPPEAVGSIIKIYKGSTEPAGGTDLNLDRQGRYILGTLGVGTGSAADGAVGAVGSETNDGIDLTIKAIDVSGFRDEQITFTLIDGRTEAQMEGDGGGIDPSDAATVTVVPRQLLLPLNVNYFCRL